MPPMLQSVSGATPVNATRLTSAPIAPNASEFKIVDDGGVVQRYWMDGAERTIVQALAIAAGRIVSQPALAGITAATYLAALPTCNTPSIVP